MVACPASAMRPWDSPDSAGVRSSRVARVMAGTAHVDYEAMARAIVMVSRYSADITELAVQSVGRGDIENRDIQSDWCVGVLGLGAR